MARTGTTYSDIELVATHHRLSGSAELREKRAAAPGALVLWHFLDPDGNARHGAMLDRSILFFGSAIASDAMPWSGPDGAPYTGGEWPLADDKTAHPRSSGTFTRFLRRWCLERGAVSLIDAVTKCTLIPAGIVEATAPAFRRKGRIQAGCDADIVVFDPATLRDRAIFARMNLPSEGMVHVLVNGEAVIRNRALVEGAAPGRPIRRGDA